MFTILTKRETLKYIDTIKFKDYSIENLEKRFGDLKFPVIEVTIEVYGLSRRR